jgi:hypothetical protein
VVNGIDIFRRYFAGYEDHYALIGGAACDLVFGEAGLPFRATKDIDMVLCVEVVNADFAVQMTAFLMDGGYTARLRADGAPQYYRFQEPTDPTFPAMLELFARKPDLLVLPDGALTTRVPVDDGLMSLSAILLNEDYYAALKAARRQIDGVTVLDESVLIPFKARAFLDLSDRKARGDAVDSQHIKKHRSDVIRLVQLLIPTQAIPISAPLRDDLRRFLAMVHAEPAFNPRDLNVKMTRDRVLEILSAVYALG